MQHSSVALWKKKENKAKAISAEFESPVVQSICNKDKFQSKQEEEKNYSKVPKNTQMYPKKSKSTKNAQNYSNKHKSAKKYPQEK